MLTEKIIIGQKEYRIRQLSSDNEAEIQDLCERGADFFELTEGRRPEKDAANQILSDLPPGKEMIDKYVIGVYNENAVLVAIIDIVKGYKESGEWMIGLLLLDPRERGNGLGRNIHAVIKKWVSEENGSKLRIGVVEANRRGYQFWCEMGYFEVGKVKNTYGNIEHTVIAMNLLLKHQSAV